MEKRKQLLLAFLLLSAAICLGKTGYTGTEQSHAHIYPGTGQNEYPGVIRFHVIANSNTEEDQKIKETVRRQVFNQVAQMLKERVDFSQEDAPAEGRKTVQTALDQIEIWAQKSLQEAGAAYGADAALGICHIPARLYDDKYFPAGNYEALTITLGEGKGRNWWCVIFPPLCMTGGKEADDTEYFRETDGGRIVLKSKILETLSKNKRLSGKC